MDFSFFTTDNKSGYKTTEKWLSKNYPEFYNELNEYAKTVDLELPFKEKIWFYFNKLKERPKCVTCNGDIKFRNRLDKPYGEFCSLPCINSNNEEMVKRQKETFNKKYGIDFYPQHKEFLEKRDKTKLERYGNKNYNNMEKNRKTKLLKYGDEKYVNIEKTKKTVLEKYGVDNYAKSIEFKTLIDNRYKELYKNHDILDINGRTITLNCDLCKKSFITNKQLVYEREHSNAIICTYCNPLGQSFVSQTEQDVNNFIISLGVQTEQTHKLPISKKEIDILIPSKNIGIEVNGVYWHNELFKDSNFHLNKTVSANTENIDLLHIFEDEWNTKKDIVKSILKNRIGINLDKIYARKCDLREVPSKESKLFLDRCHIQGNVNALIRIGLYFKNELVSIMTFSKGRIIMSGKKDEWELLRFANKLNTNVIGAASKLLNYFNKKYKPLKIISYSDIRLFNGKLYEKIGFKKISQSPPNYWYVINGLRYYRFNYRKSILIKEGFDPNKTEHEIMLERGIYRIYDCGTIRWEYYPLQLTN